MIRIFPILLVLLFAAGCASRKIDWASRVNQYTYDQAIVELGPPDKTAKLSDGSTVAEWYQRRSGPSIGLGTGIGHGPVGVGVGVPVTGRNVRVTRLTFDPEGVLRSVSQ